MAAQDCPNCLHTGSIIKSDRRRCHNDACHVSEYSTVRKTVSYNGGEC